MLYSIIIKIRPNFLGVLNCFYKQQNGGVKQSYLAINLKRFIINSRCLVFSYVSKLYSSKKFDSFEILFRHIQGIFKALEFPFFISHKPSPLSPIGLKIIKRHCLSYRYQLSTLNRHESESCHSFECHQVSVGIKFHSTGLCIKILLAAYHRKKGLGINMIFLRTNNASFWCFAIRDYRVPIL